MGGMSERAGWVAQVCVDIPLPHLDRPFDYLVPAELEETCRPGCRVKVRFAGRDRDGWVLEVRPFEEADEARTLAPIRRLVSAVVTLTPEIAALARRVADRYAGTLTDVLRFAVPPRHARAEAGVLAAVAARAEVLGGEATTNDEDAAGSWDHVVGGPELLRRLEAGQHPRAVWTHAGGPTQFRAMLLAAVRATLAAGRGVIVVVPDVRDVERLAPVLFAGVDQEVVRLVASDGPSVRARAHLRAAVGLARVVIGTRAAAWAPVHNLGLLVCVDDGDDSLVEQRAPYPHAAHVLAMRSEPEEAALLVAGTARSAWAQHLVTTGWAVSLTAARATVRATTPRVRSLDEVDLDAAGGPARIPTPAWQAIGRGLGTATDGDGGPVLIQVPRAGYVPQLACAQCRQPAMCRHCGHALGYGEGPRSLVCVGCGRAESAWTCPTCHAHALRALRVGVRRTAEELGRAFPQTPVVVSEAALGITPDLDARPRLVVATPGAEPEAEGGYACAVLLDAAAATSLPGLAGGEESARRWFHAAALVRAGGEVVVAGGGDRRVHQALVRWDPVGLAERDLTERRDLRLPPTWRVITVTGASDVVASVLADVEVPDEAELLGPVPATEPGEVRAVLRAPLACGAALSRAVFTALSVRSAHKREGAVRVVVDPRDL